MKQPTVQTSSNDAQKYMGLSVHLSGESTLLARSIPLCKTNSSERGGKPGGLASFELAKLHCSTGDAPSAGMVLILVLVVVALLSLAALSFSQWMLAEREAADLALRQSQAQALADSGIEMARLFLALDPADQNQAGGWYDNPQYFRARLVRDDTDPRWRGRVGVLSPAVDDMGLRQGIRFGLEDESTKLNLNTLLLADEYAENGARQILMALPGMTEEIADAILDWIDPDNEPREYGAEADYYAMLDPPYLPKNGPLESIEELLLVRGVTPALLFGADANRNGMVDPDEPPAEAIEGVDNTDGVMDSGWSAYLTLYSMELNVRPDGRPKVYLNQDNMEQLYKELEQALGPTYATFIVAYRQNGPYTGSEPGQTGVTGQLDLAKPAKVKLTQVLDLVGVRVRVTFQGDDRPTVLESPFPDAPVISEAYMKLLMDNTTVNPSPLIPGRININQAPRVVLAGIPGMTPEILEEILTRRQKDPVDRPENRQYETWIYTEGIVTLAEMKALMPFITGGGHVFRGQFVGYFDGGGPSARVEAVLDATVRPARVLFWRNLSYLGRGYPLETLGIELETGLW
jgi:type II secretory pathway component PulK